MEVRLSQEFDAPAEAVWKIVGAFHGLHRWFPGVTACDRDEAAWGEVRRAALGARVTPERLELYDNAAMTCAWSLVDAPLLGEHRSTLSIAPVGEGRCRADWVFYADPKPPLDAELISKNTAAMYGGALAAVREHVEKSS
ncbi:SRPBCC family protein [Phenylobacterium sp.]|uniref:SRPBCC family protein n=1 Tax=Phenylobacterium sp. TaxID=1871053 RepID=UPI0035B16360